MTIYDALKKYWGYTQFRLRQEEIIHQIIAKKDVLALLPTGGGKSICYQIPAIINEGICIVISPLIALMHDQLNHLKSKGIKSIAITSEMHYSEIDTALTNCIYGGIKFLYLSPEQLQNDLVRNRIRAMNINLIAVDEAHCISEWGHNFRPSYRKICEIRNITPLAPILALTATATTKVAKDIQENLLFKNKNIIKSSFLRKNISYVVENIKQKEPRILELLDKIKSSAIIYVNTRKKAEILSNYLINKGYSADYYHAGLPSEKRKKKQEDWNKNQIRIIVATNAFGMGINKSDIKLVVHNDLPHSIESYYQESGRAGRNGKSAYSFLLANNEDIANQEKFLLEKYPIIDEIIECYQNIANYLHIGVGDFPEDPISFDIAYFSKKYKINNIKLSSILKYLENEGKVKLLNTQNSYSKLKIIVSNTELYKFQITNRFYDQFIKLLLRTYDNLFNHLIIINEKKIAQHFQSTEENISKILTKLHQFEILKYQKKSNQPQIIYLKNREDLKKIYLNKKKWDERKKFDKNKIQALEKYIKNITVCRSKQLLNYFGEQDSKNCGVCDFCVNEKRSNLKNKI